MDRRLDNLQPEEIEIIFNYVRSQSVNHLDVQYELVDHIACEVEASLQQSPQLDFEEAFEMVCHAYTPKTFAKIVKQKRKALNRYWFRFWWNMFKNSMKPIYLVAFLVLAVAFVYLETQQDVAIGSVIFMTSTVVLVLQMIRLIFLHYLKEDTYERYLLSETGYATVFGCLAILWIFPDLFWDESKLGPWFFQLPSISKVLIYFCFILLLYGFHLIAFRMRSNIDKELDNRYRTMTHYQQ